MTRGPLPALLLSSILVAGPTASRLSAQERSAQGAGPSSEAVNAAIERGVDFLLRSQNRDGSWGVDLYERGLVWHDLRDGACALAAYTLLKCGFAPDHPAIQRAAAFLVEGFPRHTYASGIQLHALGAIDAVAHKKRMQELVELLLDLEEPSGWDYPGLGRPDLSNTQVAALGFRAAGAGGLALPKDLWSQLVDTALRYQESPVEVPGAADLPKERRRMAGFAYEVGGQASASMTTAGLTILGIVRQDPRTDSRLAARIEEAAGLALNWLAQNFSVEGNPRGEGAWHYYYLYGLERVGAFFERTEIGGHDWYKEGALQLIKEQRPEGGWWMDGRARWPPAPMPVANTCFALLFLRKATLSGTGGKPERFARMEEPDSDVWVRLDAKEVWTVWLSGFAPRVLERFRPAGAGAQGGSGIFVERVEWWIGETLVATESGEPSRPWSGERFAIQHRPAGGGELELECRVTLRGEGAETLELRSRPLQVRRGLTLEPWMLEYARDARKNVMSGHEWVLSASSEESEFHPKGDVLDGLQGSAWWARADDPEPWLRLECAKGVRLKELWLSPAAASEAQRAQCQRLERVSLRLNDSKAVLDVPLDPDERLKTKFVLPKSTLVRKLELRFPGLEPEAGKHVGLAELEGR